jgi:hypothetical protein
MWRVWRGEFHTGYGGKTQEKEKNLVDLGVNGRIILKCPLKPDRGMKLDLFGSGRKLLVALVKSVINLFHKMRIFRKQLGN